MSAIPVDANAENVLSHILESFSERVTNNQAPTSEDLQFLEKSVKLYGELCVKEAARPA
jgi:hypothetical protein